MQLQYPFSFGGTGAVLDVTIHEMRILEPDVVPEPATLSIAGLGLVLSAWRVRRNKRRQRGPLTSA